MRSASTRALTGAPVAAAFCLSVFASLAATASCSSKQGTIPGGGLTGTPQSEADGGAVPYPTGLHEGTGQRGLVAGVPGTTPGNTIANFKVLGYPNADTSQGLQTIQLADFYDPTAKKYKVLNIMAVAEWCNPCNIETSQLVTALATPSTDYESQGVVYVQALIEGHTVNIGATQGDLNDWISTQKPTFDEVLDPEASVLGVFFSAAAVPFGLYVDLRSMEVLQAGGGQEAPSDVEVWLNWVNSNPPSYTQ
jgi:hypothetical protein